MHLTRLFLLVALLPGALHGMECPQGAFQWQQQRGAFARSLIPQLGEDALYERGPRLLPATRYQRVLDFWGKCRQSAPGPVREGFSNLLKHSAFMVKAQAEGHSGFRLSDEAYLFSSFSQNPSFASLPSVFFENGYLPLDWKNRWKACRGKREGECAAMEGWRLLEFQSTLEDGSGHHRRVIVQIPHSRFQQYLLFFPDHPAHQTSRLVDVIALQTHDLDSGEVLSKQRIHFFERKNGGLAMDGGRCISCHSSGLREVHPIQGSGVEAPGEFRSFNRQLRQWTEIDWQGHYQPDALGPPMGTSCVRCHREGGARGPLTVFTKPGLIRSKVHELEMPFPALYTAHHRAVRRGLGGKGRAAVREVALSETAGAGADYRTATQVRRVRAKLHGVLLSSGTIGPWEFWFLRAVDQLSAWHMDGKLDRFFEDHKAKLLHWLQGSP